MITFSKLGNLGRLGNQLFQVASTLGIGRRNGVEVGFPQWRYSKYFEYNLPKFEGQIHKHININDFCFREIKVSDFTDISGYLQSYKFFDNINAVTNGFKKKLLDIGVPESKITVVYNWSLPMDSQHSNEFEKYRHLFEENFTIIYAGNIGLAQSLGVLISASLKLKEAKIGRVKILMLGDGTQKQYLCDEVNKFGLQEYFCFTGFIPALNVGEFLQAAGILLLHLKNDPLFEITLPSKLGSYFSLGKPVLCGVPGESSDIVNTISAGLCFTSDDSLDLYNKIISAMSLDRSELDRMGNNGKRFYDENISFEIGTEKFEEIFKRMICK